MILLREVCSIIFAPVVSIGLAIFLKELFGPLSKLWCMRFEANHNPFKRLAHVVCNFKNVSKTLAFKHQIQQMYHQKHNDNLYKKPDVTTAFLVSVGSLKRVDVLLDKLRLTLETDV